MSETNVVRKLTLVNAIVGLVKATGNFNHFLATPQGTTAMVDHLNDTRKWWPDYSTYFTDARIRILLAVYVAKRYYPELADEYKDKLGSQRVAGDVLKSCLARMGADVTDEAAIPPNVKDVWNTQDYWDKACKFADTIQNKRNEAYNLEVERKKNPGHFKVAGKWVPYGSVFTDGQGQEMVVINHTVLPKALVESRGQGFENSLAVMPLEKAQPAINRINELGGSMFAAICRVGFAEIEQLVAECGEIDVRDVAMKRDYLADPGSAGDIAAGFTEIRQVAMLEELTDEQLDAVKPGWALAEGKTRRESFELLFEPRGATLQWVAQAKPEIQMCVSSGVLRVKDVAGAKLVMVLPEGFYDGCTKLDNGIDRILEEMDENAVVVQHAKDAMMIERGGEWYTNYAHDPKVPAADRAKGGWLDPWDINNPYRENAPMFVTWAEVHLLDSKEETRARCQRHWHESSIDDGELRPAVDGRFPQFGQYVIIRPESPEKYKAICDRLRPIRRAMAMLSKPADPYWPKEQQLKHWVDLGFTEGEALDLHLRSRLLRGVNKLFNDLGWDEDKVAEATGYAKHAVADLRKGYIEMFELEELTELDKKVRQLVEENKQGE